MSVKAFGKAEGKTRMAGTTRAARAKRWAMCALILAGVALSFALAANALAQVSEFKIRNPVSEATIQLGYSCAIDGNTMILGAPYSTVNGVSGVGFASVYRRNAQGEWAYEDSLTVPGAVANSYVGLSVAVSGDTAIVGSGINAVYIFTRSSGIWTLETSLTPFPGTSAGNCAVAFSGDTLLVAPTWSYTIMEVAVYMRENGTWTKQTSITPPSGVVVKSFGIAVALDGDTAAVGACLVDWTSNYHGEVYIYTRGGSIWTYRTTLNSPDAPIYGNSLFGESLALKDGTLVAGRPHYEHQNNKGSIHVFEGSGSEWTAQASLVGSSVMNSDEFGCSVAICDGRILAGSHLKGAYVFEREGSVWTQKAKLTANDAYTGSLGVAVALSSDTAIATDTSDESGGAAYVFSLNGSAWTRLPIIACGDKKEDYFGISTAIHGNTAVVGAQNAYGKDAEGQGAAYVYTRMGTAWVRQAKLVASYGPTATRFGYSTAISHETVVVGAWKDSEVDTEAGAAYVFARSNGIWTQQAKLTAGGGGFAYFGRSVAIDGNSIVVGADFATNQGTMSGAAYVFTRSGEAWTQQAKLTPSDGAEMDRFGASVAIQEDTVVVGSYLDDEVSTNSGSIYVFVKSGGTWMQQAKLTASDGAEGDMLGLPVAISGDTIVVGAYKDDDAGEDSGSAYIFTRTDGVWSQQAKLIASDGAAGDNFGKTAVISGDTALIGAPGDDDKGSNSGSVYVFRRTGSTWTQWGKLTASDGLAGDGLGSDNSISLSGPYALVGAPYADDKPTQSGAAYVFTLPFNFGTAGAALLIY